MYDRTRIKRTLIVAALCLTIAGTAALSGCTGEGGETDNGSTPSGSSSSAVSVEKEDTDSTYSDADSIKINLSGNGASVEGSGANVEGSTIKITSAGTYVVSGNLSDGNIVIDAGKDDQVKLVLNNASISSSSAAAINVQKCRKVLLVLEKGTDNTVSDGGTYSESGSDSDDSASANAAIYAESDLTILGEGTLNVNGNYHNGITSKDTLLITGGNINVTSANHGITGKDNLQVSSGTVNVTSGGDGMRSTNSDEEKTDLGHVIIENGNITINAKGDGIQSEKDLTVSGGTLEVTTTASGNDSDTSAKGLKAGSALTVSAGEITIDSADDAMHSNNTLAINGGTVSIKAGDDGIHADSEMTITDGTITITESYEGIEAEKLTVSGGTIDVKSSDDGINCAGGNDQSGFGGMDGKMKFGGPGGEVSSDASLVISGGTIFINSQGDGVDSNGSIDMSGGTVVINGTTMGGNGILDHGGTMNVTGGTIIGAGTSDMLEMPDSTSSQRTMVVLFDGSQNAGTLIYVTDSSGKVVAAMAPEKNFSCFVLSSPSLSADEEYKVYLGGTASGEETHGYYSKATVNGGTLYSSFKLSDTVTYANKDGVTTYNGGFGGADCPIRPTVPSARPGC